VAIDRDALRKIAQGDADTKVAVRRQWLVAVLKELEELDELRKKGSYADRIEAIAERLTGKRAA
jgi:hypothetical protein